MCVVKVPKIKDDGVASAAKPLPILRNPLLDGIAGSIHSLQLGRGALRIDRITDSVAGPTGGTSPSGSVSGSVSGGSGGGSGLGGGGSSSGGGGGGNGGGRNGRNNTGPLV